jgi:hypothetical protein
MNGIVLPLPLIKLRLHFVTGIQRSQKTVNNTDPELVIGVFD